MNFKLIRIVAALFIAASAAAGAQTLINPASITSYPYTINLPGSYKLSGNLHSGANTAILLNATGVTLDLNGYSIIGTFTCATSSCTISSSNSGVLSYGNNNIIQNGSISGYPVCVESSGGLVQNITTSNCGIGVYAETASVRNISATLGDYGIFAVQSNVEGSTVSSSWLIGIDGEYSSLINNTVTYVGGSGTAGIWLSYGVAGSNTINQSGTGGIDLDLSSAISQKNNFCTTGLC